MEANLFVPVYFEVVVLGEAGEVSEVGVDGVHVGRGHQLHHRLLAVAVQPPRLSTKDS